jgi:hypothetical protein
MDKEPISIEVFSGTSWESAMIKSLLENSEIDAFLKNDILNSGMYDPIYAEGVKVIVRKEDYKLAKEIVEEYRRNK